MLYLITKIIKYLWIVKFMGNILYRIYTWIMGGNSSKTPSIKGPNETPKKDSENLRNRKSSTSSFEKRGSKSRRNKNDTRIPETTVKELGVWDKIVSFFGSSERHVTSATNNNFSKDKKENITLKKLAPLQEDNNEIGKELQKFNKNNPVSPKPIQCNAGPSKNNTQQTKNKINLNMTDPKNKAEKIVDQKVSTDEKKNKNIYCEESKNNTKQENFVKTTKNIQKQNVIQREHSSPKMIKSVEERKKINQEQKLNENTTIHDNFKDKTLLKEEVKQEDHPQVVKPKVSQKVELLEQVKHEEYKQEEVNPNKQKTIKTNDSKKDHSQEVVSKEPKIRVEQPIHVKHDELKQELVNPEMTQKIKSVDFKEIHSQEVNSKIREEQPKQMKHEELKRLDPEITKKIKIVVSKEDDSQEVNSKPRVEPLEIKHEELQQERKHPKISKTYKSGDDYTQMVKTKKFKKDEVPLQKEGQEDYSQINPKEEYEIMEEDNNLEEIKPTKDIPQDNLKHEYHLQVKSEAEIRYPPEMKPAEPKKYETPLDQPKQDNSVKPDLPPEKQESLNQIAKIKQNVSDLLEEVNNFFGSETHKDYIYLDEMLTRNLLKLDNVETHGDRQIRSTRRDVIKFNHTALGKLRTKVDEYNEKMSKIKGDLAEAEENQRGDDFDEKMEVDD